MEDEINLRDYIDVVWRRKKVIILITLVVAATALITSLLTKPVYEAKTTLLIRGASSSIGQFSGVAGMLGLSLPSTSGSSMGDLIDMLESDALAEKVIDSLNLRARIRGWDKDTVTKGQMVAGLKGMVKTPKPKSNLLEIKVEYTDPELAANIANEYVEALKSQYFKLNYTEARKKREYVESQLPEVEAKLRRAENKLKNFTTLIPKGGGSSSSLKELLSSSGLSSTSQGIEVGRLLREMEIQNTVYTLLRKEYEQAKLEESKELEPFSLIDEAVEAEKPFKPRIKLNTLIGLVLGLFGGTFIVFFQEYWEKSK